MQLQWLKEFIEIARTGSMNQAAFHLYSNQPNLSKNMKKLEAHLGVVLFERTKTGCRLTYDGRKFLPYAKNILREYEAWQLVHWNDLSQDDGITGTVHFLMRPTLLQTYYAVLHKSFQQHFPKAEFIFYEEHRSFASEGLFDAPQTLGLSFTVDERPLLQGADALDLIHIHQTPLVVCGKAATAGSAQLADGNKLLLFSSVEDNGAIQRKLDNISIVTSNLEFIRNKLESDSRYSVILPQMIAVKEILPYVIDVTMTPHHLKKNIRVSLVYNKKDLASGRITSSFLTAMEKIIKKAILR